MEALKQYVIDAVDRVAARVEEGAALLMSAKNTIHSHVENHEMSQEEEEYYDDESSSSPLSSMANGVLKDILASQRGPQTVMEHLAAFKSAIRWTEPFILCILGWNVILLVLTIYFTRKNSFGGRTTLFAIMGISSRLLPTFNSFLSKNWEEWNISQNYFDESGTFFAIMLSAPMLILCVILLLSFLWEAKNLLVQVKRLELQQRAKNEKRKKEKQN